ncbi:MAG: bifunctional precorrin-2 dehydrogenase/sirohydrochlorin ferrochelatase [Nostocoides sp.]
MSLPLLLDLTGRRVVLVGGGLVAARRATTLHGEGASVHVIAPDLVPALADLVRADAITWTPRGYAGTSDLTGAWLVHTATGDAVVDAQVATDADAAAVWCINAGAASTTRASIPARGAVVTADGPVQVAAYAGGDPRRAMAVRDSILALAGEGLLDLRARRPRDGGWVALLDTGPGPGSCPGRRAASLLPASDIVIVAETCTEAQRSRTGEPRGHAMLAGTSPRPFSVAS